MKRFLLLILFVLPIFACDINNNDPLPTLAPTLSGQGVKVTPSTAVCAVTNPAVTQPVPAATQPSTGTVRPTTTSQPAAAATSRPGALTPTPDKGDELDKLLGVV
jgi:hypothetical protein